METRTKIIRNSVIGFVIAVLLVSAGAVILVKIKEHRLREQILTALPGSPQDSTLKAVVQSAIQRTREQIESGDDPVDRLGDLARIYQANGLLDEAIRILDLLLKLDPENPHWPHYLAFILAGYGQLEVAIPLWDRTHELAPDYMPTLLRKGEALLKLNRMEDAKDTFLRVLIKDADNPHAFHGLARIYIDQDDYETALGYLRKSMANSDGSIGIQLMVTVLEKLGKTAEANAIRGIAKTLETYSDIPDEWIHELMDYCYDPYQLVSGGGFAVYAGNVQRGIELMKRAILYDPDNAIAHYQLGVIYQQDGQLEKALASFEKASELNPQLSDAWLKRAIIYFDAGHVEAGDQILAQGLANNPRSPALHLLYGERLYKQKRTSEAVRVLKRSIELRPQEPEAYNLLARVYFEQGELSKAREVTMDSLNAEAANPVALSMMVLIAISMNDEQSALAWLREIEQQPRINQQDREQLSGFFEKAFGKKPM